MFQPATAHSNSFHRTPMYTYKKFETISLETLVSSRERALYKFCTVQTMSTVLTSALHPWHPIGSGINWRHLSMVWLALSETIASSNDASSHRPTTYQADVVNRALISRDDVKRQSGQVQTINCIEVSDSNEWYRLAPFHYTNTVTRRGLQIEINSRR